MYPYGETDARDAAADKQDALQRLVGDPLYWREGDPEFRAYVDNGFRSVYGGEEAERDAAGRTIDPAPRAATLPPFKPSVTADDLTLAGGVGENQPNAWRDVWKVQKGLANTGHYALDLTQERSGEHSPTLAQAIRDFQREKREEIDGPLLPGGPTITRMKEDLLGVNRATPTAPPETALPPDNGSADGDAVQLASYGPKQKPPRPPGPDPRQLGLVERIIEHFLRRGRDTVHDPEEHHSESPLPDKRATIFTMPNGDAYILRPLQPPEKRNPGSEFVLSERGKDEPHKAKHFDYNWDEDARRYNEERLPLTLHDAQQIQQRIANGDETVDVNDRMRAERRLVQNRQPLYLRYDDPVDGTTAIYQARHHKTGQLLWVPGDRPMSISHKEALGLGLIDWMPIRPPRTNFPEIFERESWKYFRDVPPGEGKDRVR